MLTNNDKRYIATLLKQMKDELRREMWGRADDDLNGRTEIKDVADSTASVSDYNLMMGVLLDPEVEENA